MSIPNELYMNFNEIIKQQEQQVKVIRQKISDYMKIISSQTNTINEETNIERSIKSLKDMHSQLENAYSNRNAPSQIPAIELDRRQKEIQQLGINVQEIEKSFKNAQSQKYAFKGNVQGEYNQTNEMRNMTNSELVQFQKEKMKAQDEQLDDITRDVKRGRVLAKEAKNTIEEQNKQLDSLQDDIDKLDSRFQRGIKRFENYVAKQSSCCIILILIIELILAFVIYILFS